MCLKGSSFKSSKQMNQWRDFSTQLSRLVMIPLLHLVLTTVLSYPTVNNFRKGALISVNLSNIASLITSQNSTLTFRTCSFYQNYMFLGNNFLVIRVGLYIFFIYQSFISLTVKIQPPNISVIK